jgi:hypothetical protein
MPSDCTASRIAMAQRIARCGPSNIASKTPYVGVTPSSRATSAIRMSDRG